MRSHTARRTMLRDAVAIAIVCVVYVAAARLGLSLAHEHSSITAVWPPSGIALAALLLGGVRLWPGVALGALIANASSGAGLSLVTLTGITAGNTLEAVVAVVLLHHFGFRLTLERLHDVAALVIAVAVSTTISAAIGVASLRMAGVLTGADQPFAFLLWWLGDMTGDLLIAPVLLMAALARPRRQDRRSIAEGMLLLSGLGVVSLAVFSGLSPLAYLVFPFLIVAAIRLGQAGAVLASLLVAAVAVPMTASGRGPFSVGSPDEQLLLCQTFLATAIVTALVLGALTIERRRARDELEGMVREGAARLTEREVQLAQARELERAKDEVVALVSHDLRTPLTSIRGYTELLLTDHEAVGERARPYVEVIDRNSGKLLDLVDDLLIVARHNVGAFTLRAVDTVDLDELVSHEVLALMPEAADRGITLRAITGGGAAARGDRARLARMLGNLVSNAVKHTEPGSTVEVTVEQRAHHALIRVRDDGPGIAVDQQQRIFDRFAQLRDGVDGAQGYGLGLTIARAIAEAHGGRIGIDSAPGTGATFWVELPCGPVDTPTSGPDEIALSTA